MQGEDSSFFKEYGLICKRVIGEGNYGVIYEVYSLQYKMNFAVKRIKVEKFKEQEIQCMISIREKNIVPLYQYYKYGSYVYLLMELCNSSIDDFINSNVALSDEKLIEIAIGCIDAVNSCHKNGIYHGDIKPSNFLLDQYGRIKICDFGLSEKIAPETSRINWNGTLVFFSPERILVQPHDPYAADIWALGVTLYWIATKQYPFCITNKNKLAQEIILGEYDESLIHNEFLRDIISCCLQLNPAMRCKAAELHARATNFNYEKHSSRIIRPSRSAKTSTSLILRGTFSKKSRRLSAH